jgi:hypothetical protein
MFGISIDHAVIIQISEILHNVQLKVRVLLRPWST